MKILLVDDSEDSLLLLKTILSKAGFQEITCVTSAREALDMLGVDDPEQAQFFDLIFMDVVMPEMDGIEACRIIKSTEHLQDIPVIIITAKDEEKTLEAAFNAGAIDYITKSTGKVVLLARTRSALSLKKERDQRKAREEDLLATTKLLEKANEKLRQQSLQDGLTGVANRRRFDEKLSEEWERGRRDQRPISLLMIDIDQFKLYNDEYGHLAGDDCLKEVAYLLSKRLKRPADLLSRYGGEEFAVLLPETGLNGARDVAEELRTEVEQAGIFHAKLAYHEVVTISLGVSAITPELNNTANDLLKQADEALYQAKSNGRNRVETFWALEKE